MAGKNVMNANGGCRRRWLRLFGLALSFAALAPHPAAARALQAAAAREPWRALQRRPSRSSQRAERDPRAGQTQARGRGRGAAARARAALAAEQAGREALPADLAISSDRATICIAGC